MIKSKGSDRYGFYYISFITEDKEAINEKAVSKDHEILSWADRARVIALKDDFRELSNQRGIGE